ncbi:unannotated protein [freshwater metagenome]|uniref:Unannotated protein n=1 Tax=freshwater metagenome TaxID=449393 RepID=A0A6J6ULX0_9ZZZZ
MHDVGTCAVLQVPCNRVGEIVDNSEQFIFRHVKVAGRDMHHSMVWFYLDNIWQPCAPCTRVGGAIDTTTGKRRHQFAHVHIHAATVANTWLGQGRGVHREHSYALHYP